MPNEITFVCKEEMLVYPVSGGITFSPKIRANTPLGRNTQGEHCTAYALFIEFIMVAISKKIKENSHSNNIHVTELVDGIITVVDKCKSFLNIFGLEESASETSAHKMFVKVFDDVNGLRFNSDEKLKKIYELIKGHEESIRDYSHIVNICNLAQGTIDYLNESIKEIKNDYFKDLAVCLANAYLNYQNKADYVTFKKVDGHLSSKDQGSKVRNALALLREYIDIKPDVATQEEIKRKCEEEIKKPSTRQNSGIKKNFYNNANEYITVLRDAEMEKLLKPIVSAIKDLFFYPKIDPKMLNSIENADKGTCIRNNSLDKFKYVVARHLFLVFKTFSGLESDKDMKNEISKRYINEMMLSWNISKKLHEEIRKKIIEVIDISPKSECAGTPAKNNAVKDRPWSLMRNARDDAAAAASSYAVTPIPMIGFISSKFGCSKDDSSESKVSTADSSTTEEVDSGLKESAKKRNRMGM